MVWAQEFAFAMKKLCLVTSGGGHLFQLYQLKQVWQRYPRFWVTFNKADVVSLIPKEKKYYAAYPESRHLGNALKNLWLAFELFRKKKPEVVLSMGAGIAVPFFLAAKLSGVKTIYIEPIDFIQEPSLTGRLISLFRLADLFLVQHPALTKFFPKSRYWGNLL
jgi:UDP-N-acetylglucosamine:LPS N-acetylglucosamine transferase